MRLIHPSRRAVLQMGAAALFAPAIARSASAQGLSGTVRIWTFLSAEGTSPREVVLRELIQGFTAANPGVQVLVEPQPFQELETKFVAASAQGRAPDLIWMRDTFLSLVHARGALANLDDELSDSFRAEVLPDLYQVFANKSVFDGFRTSLPLWPSPAQVIFYRKDVLGEVGLDAPPGNWDAFVPVAGQLTKGDRLGFGLPSNDNSVSSFVNIMTGFGPGIFDAATGRFDVTGPEAVAAAEVVRQLVANGALSRTLLNAMGDDIQDQFAAGRFAMAQAFAPRFQQYRNIAAAYDPAQLSVAPWPAFGDRPPAALLGPYWTVGLSARSENRAAAVAFLETLYTPAASLQWSRVAGLVPDRRSVQSDAFYASPQAEVIRIFAGLLDSPGALTFPQNLPDITRVFPVMNIALQELIGTDEAIGAILGRARASLGW